MDEVLVHISVPATRQNDDLFRSLADAYVDFEPYKQAKVESPGKNKEQENTSITEPNVAPPATPGEPAAVLIDMHMSNASSYSYGSFPSHMSPSNTGIGHTIVEDSFGLSIESDSLIPISRLEQMERIQVNWRKKRNPRLTAQQSGVKSSISPGDLDTMFIEDSQLAAQALESQLYVNGSSTSEDASEDEMIRVTRSQSVRTGTIVGMVSTSQASSNFPRVDEELCSSTELASTHCQTDTNRSHGRTGDDNTLHGSLDFSDLSFEVFAPVPKTSVESPGTLPSQLTTFLQTTKLQNPRRFKPSKKSRALDADERGYWLVENGNWPQKIQYEFWSSLCEHVRSGRFGWGVTLFRDSPNNHSTLPEMGQQLGPVRLYCWGEMVEHIWLSLWLCSNGKLLGSGSRWFDAGDNVVIRVP